MTKLTILAGAAAALAFLAPGAAFGQSAGQAYVGLGASHTRDDATGADMTGVQGRIGVQATPMIGIEAEAATGLGNDDSGKLDGQYGVYGVARAPVNRNFDVFARAGVSRVNEFGRGAHAGQTYRDDALGYGAGAQVNLNERVGLRADWTRHDGDREIDTVGASIVRKF
ncbi:MAG: porin family protein [Hyphomonadaceae bacterium]|nr:porin family protein [Hyphomonadaceae bacterium]